MSFERTSIELSKYTLFIRILKQMFPTFGFSYKERMSVRTSHFLYSNALLYSALSHRGYDMLGYGSMSFSGAWAGFIETSDNSYSIVLGSSKEPWQSDFYHVQRRHGSMPTGIKNTTWIIFEAVFDR